MAGGSTHGGWWWWFIVLSSSKDHLLFLLLFFDGQAKSNSFVIEIGVLGIISCRGSRLVKVLLEKEALYTYMEKTTREVATIAHNSIYRVRSMRSIIKSKSSLYTDLKLLVLMGVHYLFQVHRERILNFWKGSLENGWEMQTQIRAKIKWLQYLQMGSICIFATTLGRDVKVWKIEYGLDASSAVKKVEAVTKVNQLTGHKVI